MDFKKLIIYLTAVMLISFGIGFTIVKSTGGFKAIDFSTNNEASSYKLNHEKIENIDGLKNISIKTSIYDINVIPEDRENIKINLYSTNPKNTQKINTVVNNDTLEISTDQNKDFKIGFNFSSRIDVFVPKTYKDNLEIVSGSCDISIEKEIVLDTLSIDQGSGDTTLKNITVNTLNYSASSGSLEGDNIYTQKSNMKISSGDIELNNFTGDLNGEASSGEFDVNYLKFDNNVNLQISSGDIDLDLPDNAQFYLEAECSSGDIECDFPITINGKYSENELKGVAGNDKNKITLKASSGDINIE